MYSPDFCRICLLDPIADKDIRDLKIDENDCNKSYVEILLFCLDIQIVENSTVYTKLCGKCYESILAYHKFKTLALRNDHYLKTINQSNVKVEQIIKHELESEVEIGDTNTEIEIDKFEVNNEFDNDNTKSDDDGLLNIVKKPEEVKKEQSTIDENKKSVKGAAGQDDKLESNMTKTSKIQSMTDDHPVSEYCLAAEEAPSSSKLSDNNVTDNKPPENKNKTIEFAISEETDQMFKETMKFEEIINNSNVRFEKMALNAQSNTNLKAANEHASNICNYTTNNVSILKSHIKSHSARRHRTYERPFACEICDKKFIRKGNLEVHIRIHTGEQPYACEICDKKFIQKNNLEVHRRIHTGEKPYACEICDKKFTVWSNLKAHIRIHTGEKPYACKICGRKFAERSTLQTHISQHTGEKPYACEVCDKKFTKRYHLERHIRIHTGEKPYACKLCDKRFMQNGHLKDHMKIHTDIKPYACEICDRKFIRKDYLDTHIRTHTGEKPYACETCDKKFSVKSTLEKHIRIHTGEKPYACEICNINFRQQCHLNQHIKIHTGEKPSLACEICDKKFTGRSTLRRHIRDIHNT